MSLPSSSTKPQQPRRSLGLLRTILLHTRGVITNRHARHVAMFYSILIPMLMAFVGYEFLWGWMEPHEHFYRFAIYWIIVGWLTILAALLALYEMLILRVQHRLERRALKEKMLGRDLDPDRPQDKQ